MPAIFTSSDKYVQIASEATGAGEKSSAFFGARLRVVNKDGLMNTETYEHRFVG